MKGFLASFFFVLINICSYGQRNCGTAILDSMRNQNLAHQHARQEFETQLQKEIHFRKQSRMQFSDSLITIPVVVHVVYNINKPEQNISDEQIFSQIAVLNEDFRRRGNGANSNPKGADINIEFCLANQDPQGQFSSGITRHSTSKAIFDIFTDDVELKSNGYWPSDSYLNIWVCNLESYLGYTQFPDSTGLQGLQTTYNTALTDGVVIDYEYFGRKIGTATKPKYNLGRTGTHEIGHWFGLKHTWGDESSCAGDDYCDDTPACNGQYYSHISQNCPAPFDCGSVARQIQNYLDYSDDGCMNLFTLDQKKRMRTVLDISPRRFKLRFSQGCKWKGTVDVDSSIVTFFPNPSDGNLQLSSLKPADIAVYNQLGVKVYSNRLLAGSNSIFLDLPAAIYILEINNRRQKLMIK